MRLRTVVPIMFVGGKLKGPERAPKGATLTPAPGFLTFGMEERPPLPELDNHVRTIKWHALGIQLGLEENDLLAINPHLPIDDRRRAMFNLWLSNTNANSRQLIEALRKPAVKENYMADEYERYIISLQSSHGMCLSLVFCHPFSYCMILKDKNTEF